MPLPTFTHERYIYTQDDCSNNIRLSESWRNHVTPSERAAPWAILAICFATLFVPGGEQCIRVCQC